jgi:two-component system, OmpR family, phosphate regulon sensor histidine kinase PhoR
LTGQVDAVLLEAVLDQLPIGVVVADTSGRIARANQRARELLGGDLVDGLVEELAAERGVDSAGKPLGPSASPLGRALFAGELVTDEVVDVLPPDGVRRTISATTRRIHDADGRLVGAIAIVEDVSARGRQEQAEREFIANAAHELRTPLAAIASAIEVLQHGAKDLPTERDRFLAHIARESDRLQRLARALLILARADVHAEPPRLEIVPLRGLLTEIAGGLTVAPTVKLSVRCRRDVAVLANRDLLEQALLNVAGNATRYTESGSIRLSCRARGDSAVISIRDSGQGMPRAEIDRVFERFFRSGSRDAQGFGLGLSIARQAIEAVGGQIRIESTEGKGTIVEVVLPLARMVRS